MAFLSLVCTFALRLCLSVTIVAMVNQSAVTDDVQSTNATTVVGSGQCPRDVTLRDADGEFIWNRHQQGAALATYYYGFIISQIPGGWIADRYGGKWLLGSCVLVSSVISLLSPAAARIHLGVFLLLRILSGFSAGFHLPALHALTARWSAPKNRSLVVSVINVGSGTGVVVAMMLSGVLCDHGFAGGWPSVFYVFGMIGCLWSGAWFLLCYDSPSRHPRISTAEKEYWRSVTSNTDVVERPQTHPPISTAEQEYWQSVTSTTDVVERPQIPWRKILTSVPVWALALTFFADNWGFTTLANCIPLFMHDVLGFNMTNNGVLSAIPFLARGLMIPVGWFTDWLRSPGRLSTDVVRKMFCATGLILAGSLLVLNWYTDCNRPLAVTLLFLAIASSSISYSVVTVNPFDLAPLHAGKIMGLAYCFANLAPIATPHVFGAMTYHRSTRSEWQNVFFLAGGIYAVGATIFVIFGSGKPQNW